MAKELDEPLSIIEKIPPRDKEVILLATTFFWGKYKRRRIYSKDFKPLSPEIDWDDDMSRIMGQIEFYRQQNDDIDGDAVDAVSNILSKHPMRDKFFPHLDNKQKEKICSTLNTLFEIQEFKLQKQDASFYCFKNVEEFAINVTDTILHLKGGYYGITWFGKIDKSLERSKYRQSIIRAVLNEKLSGKIDGLLSLGKDKK